MAFLPALHLQFPLIQAPMAGVQGSALAIAVCNAGALGSLPCAMLTPQALAQELAAITAATQKPYNVNFFCHTQPQPDSAAQAQWLATLAPYFSELGLDTSTVASGPGRLPFSHDAADVLQTFKPAVVSFHFGLPEPDLLARVKSWGSLVLASATTVAEAQWLAAHGADAVIAQGLEAGGHRGHFLNAPANSKPLGDANPWLDTSAQMGTLALLPQIVSAIDLPVIAAGGLADAAGVRAAMALGASAVQIGTAYLLCHEATTSAVHRRALQSPAAQHTALTNLFTGRPARGIVNRLMRELGPIGEFAPQFPLATTGVAPLRAASEAQGSGDFSPLWAGQNTSGCLEIGAAHLTAQLAAGFGLAI